MSPLTQKEREAFKKEIEFQVSQAAAQFQNSFNATVDSFKPHGWKRFTHFLREWGLAATAIAIPVALLAIALSAAYVAMARVGKEATFETQTGTTLTQIQSDIQGIKGQLTSQNLAIQANLPSGEFKSALPEISSALATASEHNLKLQPSTLASLSSKVASIDTNAPQLWPVVVQLINYRSQTLSDLKPDQSMPGCYSSNGAEITGVGFEDCVLDLDGKFLMDSFCNRCVVRYSGGELHIVNLKLNDCLIVFRAASNGKPPAPDGQQLERTLLVADDLKQTTISSLSTHGR
jgi:hypothetical protein